MTEPMLLFTLEEYAQRVEAVRGEMRASGADLLLVDEAEHLCSLTGFDRSATRYQVCVVPLDSEPVIFLRSLAFSETVVVTESGAERLAQAERALLVR